MSREDPYAVVAALPAATRHLLLVAACASPEELRLFLAALPEDAFVEWAPAERAGLVRLGGADGDPLRWTDPALADRLYGAATFVERRRAHLALADGLSPRPDRRAWHRAAVQLGPVEAVAAELEQAAPSAQRSGGWPAAARLLERAAELSPDADAAARRYVLASRAAIFAGDAPRVTRLGDRVLELADDPSLTLQASVAQGWAMAMGQRHAEAVTLLTSAAVRAVCSGAVDAAWAALPPAAVAAYYSGRREHREQVAAAFDVVRHRVPSATATPQSVWLAAALDPTGSVDAVGAALDAAGDLADLDQITLNQLGGAAWIVDRTEEAATALQVFLDRQGRAPERGANALVSSTLASLHWDLGRWDEAEARFRDTVRVAERAGMEMVRRTCDARLALCAAARGLHEQVPAAVQRAVAGLPADERLSVAVLARTAQGVSALGEGEHERAYDVLRPLVDEKGAPRHERQALYAMTDLVTAAVRTGRHAEAADVVAQLRDRAAHGSARLQQLVRHASALVAAAGGTAASLADAEAAYVAAVADPRGATWPFERARLQLDLGSWLRRERRLSESRPHLVAAHETFRRLGAAPWERQAAGELRALGVRRTTRRGRLADLTPQQQEIVRLAARGLSNPEIAERLFLSPRTVSSHLYRAFPLLGITARGQLRDVVEEQ